MRRGGYRSKRTCVCEPSSLPPRSSSGALGPSKTPRASRQLPGSGSVDRTSVKTQLLNQAPSGDMGSSSLLSSSTWPRGTSEGRLKLVLRLELPLLERPGRFPAENDARRGDEGSIGDGDAGGGEGMDEAPSSNDGISVWGVSEQESGGQMARTTLNFVQFSIVAYVGCLRLCDLHLAILLQLGECDIRLVPLQATLMSAVEGS